MDNDERENENLDDVMKTLKDMIARADEHIRELEIIAGKRCEDK